MTSVALPAVSGTMMRTGLSGQVCASAAPVTETSASANVAPHLPTCFIGPSARRRILSIIFAQRDKTKREERMIGRRTAMAAGLAALAPIGARGDSDWKPTKPIRLIVPYGPGGSADQVARLYGEWLSAALGQQVIVEDKPGASGGVGAQMVAASAPDGYTFLLAPTAILAITPGVRQVPYNPDDLAAVCRLSTTMLPVTITNALGARSWQEFVVLARQNPGKYWFGSSGLGTITHLTGEVLTRAAGIQMQHSPYKTIVDATGDIFDGRIQMVFDPSFVPYAKAGKVRLVLIDAEVRLADLPDVPR